MAYIIMYLLIVLLALVFFCSASSLNKEYERRVAELLEEESNEE